jgi:pimeloyl-ACP methyl ester carboxylesterase
VSTARPDPHAEPESLVVTVDTGDRIHYLDWGAPAEDRARPPLVLVHGLANTAWSWAPVARRLRERTNVVAPDLRGHGLSDAPRAGYDLASLAYDVLTVVTANRWGADAAGPPVVIAGHGLGALVAATAASLAPGTVAGVALVDAGWEALGASTGMAAAEFARTLGDPPEILRSMDAFLADRRGYDPSTWDADQERAARATVDAKHAGHVAPVTRPRVVEAVVDAMFAYDPLVVTTLGQPIAIAIVETGSADDEFARDRALALDDVRAARERTSGGPTRVVRFRGVGHNVMRYSPDAVTAMLAELLEAAAVSPSGGTPGDPP